MIFSDRRGGVSEGPYESLNLGVLTDDDPANVVENRRRLAARLGVEPERVAMGWQVHGTELAEWDAPPSDPGYARPGAGLERVDGHVTSVPGLGLLVLAADCYPLALSDGTSVAMVHCGWRGLAAGIVGARGGAPRGAGVGRGRARASAPAATRWGRRCSRPSPTCREWRAGACSTCARCWRCQAGRGRGERRPARGTLHELPCRPVLLTPPRPRPHGPPGRPSRARCLTPR